MKKLILACILITGASMLKAQQQQLKPKGDFSNPMEKYLKPGTDVKPDTYNLLTPKLNLNEALALNNNNVAVQKFFSKMPVAKLDGFDNMPIARFDGYDNMPILGFDLNKVKREALIRSY